MPRLNVRDVAAWPDLMALLRDWARQLYRARWETTTKNAHESRTATTILADDDSLAVQVMGGQRYVLRGVIFFDTTAAADFKWALAVPSGSTVRIASRAIAPSATALSNIQVQTSAGVANAILSGGTTGGVLWIDATVLAGADGLVSVQWAQNTSDAGATTVRAGSYLELARP